MSDDLSVDRRSLDGYGCSPGERHRWDRSVGSLAFRTRCGRTQATIRAAIDQHDLRCAARDPQRIEGCHELDARGQVRLSDEQDLVEHARRVDRRARDDLRQRDEEHIDIGREDRRERDQRLQGLDPVRTGPGDREASTLRVADDVCERPSVADDLEHAGRVGRSLREVDEQHTRAIVGERLGERARPCDGGRVVDADGRDAEVEGAAQYLHAAYGCGEVSDVGGRHGVGQERHQFATARTHMTRPADAHVERIERQRERETDRECGDGDEHAGERARRDETGDGDREHQPEDGEYGGDDECEPAATSEHVE